jgi:hypothetical protein
MANTNQVTGFQPYAMLASSGSPKVSPITYQAKAGEVINPGDVLMLVDGGAATEVESCTAATVVGVLGIAANYVAAASTAVADRTALYYPADPNIIYKVQMTDAFTADMVGKCADHVEGSGSVGTGPYGTAGRAVSGAYLSATVAATGLFKILGLAPGSVVGAYAKVLVVFNEGAYYGAANGIADA